jgi:hypothetical protein
VQVRRKMAGPSDRSPAASAPSLEHLVYGHDDERAGFGVWLDDHDPGLCPRRVWIMNLPSTTLASNPWPSPAERIIENNRAKRGVMDLTGASWNRFVTLLRGLHSLRADVPLD